MDEDEVDDVIGARILEYVLAQHSLNRGLKNYGEKGEHATKKELKQLHDPATIVPVDPKDITGEDKHKAIASLMFLTAKHDGSIKAQACADGHKQQECMGKTEMALPTAIIESIFITVAIDAKEHGDVAIMNLPGAFLHAENDEKVVMFKKGKMAELMVHVLPQIYRKYVTTTQQGERSFI